VKTILGVPCELSSSTARRALFHVLRTIRTKSPKDWKQIRLIVTKVASLNPEQKADGTMGWWRRLEPVTSMPETWDFGDLGTPGVLYVDDTLDFVDLVPNIAHELGHACTTDDDLAETGGPDDPEWTSELTADRYAYRWGFGPAIGRRRKHRDSGHHGFAPGTEFTYGSVNWQVTRGLCFRIIESKAKRKKR
jgi:hypothetical protein